MNSFKRIFILILLNLMVVALVVFSAGNNSSLPLGGSGVEVWRSKNCTTCHSIFGLGGHLGPDLTNVYSKMGEEYLGKVLKNGLRNMPDLGLSEPEINRLIRYLEHVDSLGEYPLKSLNANPFGKTNNADEQ